MSLCMAQYQETQSRTNDKIRFWYQDVVIFTSDDFTFFEARPCPPKSYCQDCHNMTIMWQGHYMTSMLSTIGSGNCLPLAKTKRNMKEHKHDKHDNVTAWQAWQAWQRHCMTSMPSTLVSGVGVNISFRAATASPDTMLWGRLILIYNHIYKSRSI